MTTDLKLNLHGHTPIEGWKILSPLPGPHVDYVGDCTDLSQFADNSASHIYAWHLLNKLDGNEQNKCIPEIYRVLKPGGVLVGAVNDMDLLCRLFVSLEDTVIRMKITSVIYGDHSSRWQINHFGFNVDILIACLQSHGFGRIFRTGPLNILESDRETIIEGIATDLNFIAEK